MVSILLDLYTISSLRDLWEITYGSIKYVTSFVANFPFHLWKSSRQSCQTLCKVDDSLQCSPSNYAAGVAVWDVSKTGIKHDCPIKFDTKLPCYDTHYSGCDARCIGRCRELRYMRALITKFLSTGVLPSLDVLN